MTFGELELPDRELPLPAPRTRAAVERARDRLAMSPTQPEETYRAGSANTRKAFVSKGDDGTRSRFVKVDPGPITPKPRQPRLQGFEHAAVGEARTYFPKSVQEPRKERPKAKTSYRVLVSAHNNVKIGRDVRKGRLKGYFIYTLTLEERATCPRSCEHFANCYGNGMPYARRNSHGDPAALMQAIEADLEDLAAINSAKRKGVLVRLHALGDFFDSEYVEFWGRMIAKFPKLCVFGYTAWLPGTLIGDAVLDVQERVGWERFAIRFSDGGLPDNSTVSIYEMRTPPGAFICPEQSKGITAAGKPIGCDTCALCWTTRKNVAFVNHGTKNNAH